VKKRTIIGWCVFVASVAVFMGACMAMTYLDKLLVDRDHSNWGETGEKPGRNRDGYIFC
jgi:hypothetical protein